MTTPATEPRNPHGVRPGQVWRDLDARFKGKKPRVTVKHVVGLFAIVERNGRLTRIRLDRFEPRGDRGYELVATS